MAATMLASRGLPVIEVRRHEAGRPYYMGGTPRGLPSERLY